MAGGIISLVTNIATLPLYKVFIIPFISTFLFTLGYFIMGINTVRWLIDSKSLTDKINEPKIYKMDHDKFGDPVFKDLYPEEFADWRYKDKEIRLNSYLTADLIVEEIITDKKGAMVIQIITH